MGFKEFFSKFPWGKAAQVGKGAAAILFPQLAAAIQVVEIQFPELKGPNKADAAEKIALAAVATIEAKAGNIIKDEKAAAAARRVTNAMVAVNNAKAELEAAKQDFSDLLEGPAEEAAK